MVFNDDNKRNNNIYWNYREDSATINWIDEDTVDITGQQLTVPKEKYDFKNEK
ncbi:hypothetical protein A1A1_17300 [Planococcus antarcticus DSM 14505]|uniref:DUF5412 domain-containing protein n=1 Tax=Planococcus antarcticus DSM 14505 TaxID=1185653 RepID=A0AA87LRC8_9BACL|nr:hypothetical protein A1A1_17300 [Planococcus antarcticus DSM 14505]